MDFNSDYFDFETHGSNWNEANQVKLSDFKQVDFIKYAYPAYEHKKPIERLSDFFYLKNTDGAYLFMIKKTKTKTEIFFTN